MNAILNQKLIDDIANKPRLTELVLKAFALRLLYLKELNEADLTDVEQELEIEEIMDFLNGHNLTISEHTDGTIVFHTKVEAPVISLRKTKVPHDVITEFLCGVEIKGDWVSISEQIASQVYESMEALIGVVKDYARNKNTFGIYVNKCRNQPFYKPHFKAPIK